MAQEIFGGGHLTLEAARQLLGLPLKMWKALLTQSGTDDPTFVEKINTTGATITIERTDTGEYIITASSAIFDSTTAITFGVNAAISGEEGPNYAFEILSETQIKIFSYSTLTGLTDSIMNSLLITIEI